MIIHYSFGMKDSTGLQNALEKIDDVNKIPKGTSLFVSSSLGIEINKARNDLYQIQEQLFPSAQKELGKSNKTP